ncbi:hypothetical protein IWW54_001772, partial [Coemansia sp. RSA 2705]
MAYATRLFRLPPAYRTATLGLRLLHVTSPAQQGIQAAQLQKTLVAQRKPLVAKENLVFGHTFTDHMLSIDWTAKGGWERPQIQPYGPLQIDPCCAVLHYALECFEGLKAYRDAQGHVRLFRPDKNMERMNNSAERLHLPQFDGAQVLECIKELLRIEKRWVPEGRGYSLYLRPTLISTENTLGVHRSNSAKLFVIASP